MGVLIGLDLGTTTIKAVAYDPKKGQTVRIALRLTPVEHPRPEWSEFPPEPFWKAVAACLREAAGGLAVDGLAISSMGEVGIPLDARNRPLYPLVAWYDRRAAAHVNGWEALFPPETQHAISGQRVNPSFGVIKWLWFSRNEPELAKRTARWLSLPDYILWLLTGVQRTDYSIASRTLLFDQRGRRWSPELLAAAGLREEQMPPAEPGGTLAGRVTPAAALETGLPAGLPCVLGGHDHLCAAFAAGAAQPGAMIDSTGTAEALVMVLPEFFTGEAFAQHSFACYAHVLADRYVLKGGIGAAGGALEWLARRLTDCTDPITELPYEQLEKEAEAGIGREAGPLWLPHLNGSGSPEADRFSRAAMVGACLHHRRGDMFRGMIESLAFWTRRNMEEMQTLTGQRVDRLIAAGGATRLKLLVQLKADALNLPVELPELPESAALGAALLAGVGSGVFASPQAALDSLQYESRVIVPAPVRVGWYDRLYKNAYLPLYGALKDVHHAIAEQAGEKGIPD
ncbi:MAG: FGGY-family carbohydrate kinase [Anaerolineaceae bacterium]|nr:FGGY-family carbohydrate kinase [Anaerolineaceae bacterium]